MSLGGAKQPIQAKLYVILQPNEAEKLELRSARQLTRPRQPEPWGNLNPSRY